MFFVGWVLSPFTTWNDLFVNIPLSYVIANFLYAFFRLPFRRLLIGAYILTNALGIVLMYLSGKQYILPAKNKKRAAATLAINVALLSAVLYFLDKSGIFMHLANYLAKLFYHQ